MSELRVDPPVAPKSERIAVVVVTFNSGRLLPDLLNSLAEGLRGLQWELIVVDNNSSDDTVDVVGRLAPWATTVALGRNAGYAAGVNAGVAVASDPTAILALNPDVRLGTGAGEELVRALRTPGVGIAVPYLADAGGRRIDSLRREPTVLRAWADAVLGARRVGRFPALGEVVTDERSYASGCFIPWAEGSTQMISAECWRRCGPWDESYFLYSEETEFNLRAGDLGYRTLYVPAARAVHLEGGSGTSAELRALLLVNRVRLFSRRNGPFRTVLFWMATVWREGARALAGHPASRVALGTLLSPARLRARPGPAWLSRATG